jgi:hypothetical protein
MGEESAARKIADGKGGPGASTITIFGMKNCGGGEWKETKEYRHSGPNGDPVKITSNMTAQEAVEAYQAMLRDERARLATEVSVAEEDANSNPHASPTGLKRK